MLPLVPIMGTSVFLFLYLCVVGKCAVGSKGVKAFVLHGVVPLGMLWVLRMFVCIFFWYFLFSRFSVCSGCGGGQLLRIDITLVLI